MLKASELAILGGKPVRAKRRFPWPVMDASEIDALTRVATGGVWWEELLGSSYNRRQNNEVEKFQEEFRAYHGAEFATATSSGTTALITCLRAWDIGPQDFVLIPDYTWISVAQAVVSVGAIPVFVDVLPGTYNIDPEAIKNAIAGRGYRKKVIIAVHNFGMPADLDEIKALGIPVIEDACLAHGAIYKNKHVGDLGNMTAFSFNQYKIVAAGEGGMILCDSHRLTTYAESIVNDGRLEESPWWTATYPGANYRMTQWSAAVARCQLRRLKGQFHSRENAAVKLRSLLADIPGLSVQQEMPDKRSSYYCLPISYDRSIYPIVPERFVAAMAAEGVEIIAPYGGALSDLPAFSRYKQKENPFAKECTKRLIGIPHPVLLHDHDLESIRLAFEKIYVARNLV